MTDETEQTGEGPAEMKVPLGLLLPLLMGGAGSRADGIGDILAQVRADHDEAMKPDLVTVTEPETGIDKLAYVTNNGVFPIPSSFFDDERDAPRYRRGNASMTSLDSFIAHVNRFGDADTAVFADDNREAPKLTAVLDYHRADGDIAIDDDPNGGVERGHGAYRHGKHRTLFAFPVSDEWKDWLKSDKKAMSMVEFSTFLERHIGDIAIPEDSSAELLEAMERFVYANGGFERIASYATLLELSRGLRVNEEAVVEEANVLQTGEGHIRFSTEHRTARVGNAGDIVKVPTMFFIAIPIFRNGAFYRLGAALRYRKTVEGIKFGYELQRADLAFDHAFREAVARVDAETEASVFYGSPEA